MPGMLSLLILTLVNQLSPQVIQDEWKQTEHLPATQLTELIKSVAGAKRTTEQQNLNLLHQEVLMP